MFFKCESPPLPAALGRPLTPRQRLISRRAAGPGGRGEGGGGAVARGGRGNPLFPVLCSLPLSLPGAEGTAGGWFWGLPEPTELPRAGHWGPGLGVPGGERSRGFGTTKKRYNYTTGYKLTLCTTESYWIFVMCSFPNRCSL